MPTRAGKSSKPLFTFVNNHADEGDRLSNENRQVVRRHCRNRWRLEREQARRARPEIRIINFGGKHAKATTLAPEEGESSAFTLPFRNDPSDRPVTLGSPWADDTFSSCNPFDTLPLPQNHWANVSIHYYLTQSRKTVPLDNAVARSELFIQRRDYWMPLATKDEAAYCSFLAWVQSDPRCPSHLRDATFAQQCHERALLLTKQKLSRMETAVEDACLFAVGMLNFVSWNLFEPVGMKVHYEGIITVMAYRNSMVIDAAGYAKSAQRRAQAKETKGYELGFKDLADMGLLPGNLCHPFRYFLGREDLTSLIERDAIGSAFMMNHVDPVPCDLGWHTPDAFSTEADILFHACHATIHVAGYLMYNNPANIEGSDLILGLEDTVGYTHRVLFFKGWRERIEDLSERYPLVLMWIAIINGAASRHLSRRNDFKWLLKHTIEATNLWNFVMATDQLSTYFTWPGAITNRVQSFWMESIKYEADISTLSVVKPGKGDSNGPRSPSDTTSSSSSRHSCVTHSSDKLGELPMNPEAKSWLTPPQEYGKLVLSGCLFMTMRRTLRDQDSRSTTPSVA